MANVDRVERTKKLAKIRAKIKHLAKKQRETKDCLRQDHRTIPKLWQHQWDLINNKVLITLLINLHHEIRGSNYRHNVPEHLSWIKGRFDLQSLIDINE